MSVEERFFGGRGNLVGPNDDGATSPLLSTPSRDRRLSLPATTENAWAMAFKINVAITAVSAVWALAKRAPGADDSGDSNLGLVGVLYDPISASCIWVALVALTYAVSRGMLRVMSTCSKQILQISFVIFVVASGMLVSWMLSSDAVLCAIFAAAVCSGVGHVFVRRGRIAFTAENLKVAALAVRCMPKVFLWSLCVAVIRLCFLILAGIALAGSIAKIPTVRGPDGTTYLAADCQTTFSKGVASCDCNGDIISEAVECEYIHGVKEMLLVCFWMATMGWGFVSITNIMTATVARSVGLWWTSPEDVESLWTSCQYVINSSLGTLCKESTIDGHIELLNEGLQRLPSLFGGLAFQSILFPPRGEDVSDILDFGADWLPWGSCVYLVQPFGLVFGLPLMVVKLVSSYVMGYIAVFVGIHGLGLAEGASCTKELFRKVGMTLIINELVVGVGLLVAGLAPFGLYLYAIFFQESGRGSLGLALLLVVVIFTHVAVVVVLLPMTEVVLCAYKAVFVCFVKDPGAFSENHDRQLLVGLSRTWQTIELSHAARGGATGAVQV